MCEQKQEKASRVDMDKWPVSFSQWTEAYAVQILGEKEKKDRKSFREGMLDKVMFRGRLILDLFAEDAKQGKESIEWMMAKNSAFFMENEDTRELYFQWRNKEEDKICTLVKQYLENRDSFEAYKEKNRGKMDTIGWTWDKPFDDELEEYIRELLKYGKWYEDLEELEAKINKKSEEFRQLEPEDLLNKCMYKNVLKVESDFYCIVMENIPSSRREIDDLKHDKWWIIDVKIREKLLRSVELLMLEGGWNVSLNEFRLIAQKLLRPHEFILTKAVNGLLCSVESLYDICNSQRLRFLQENESEFIEMEYADISDLGFKCKSEEGAETKKGDVKITNRILELVSEMNVLSQELNECIEENAICPDFMKETGMQIEEQNKEKAEE